MAVLNMRTIAAANDSLPSFHWQAGRSSGEGRQATTGWGIGSQSANTTPSQAARVQFCRGFVVKWSNGRELIPLLERYASKDTAESMTRIEVSKLLMHVMIIKRLKSMIALSYGQSDFTLSWVDLLALKPRKTKYCGSLFHHDSTSWDGV